MNNKYRARYGVALERWSFDERTADYVWMLIFGALSLLVNQWNPLFKHIASVGL